MLVSILEGLPAGVPIEITKIDADLKRRMGGYGRGKRMKIEDDQARIVGGVRHGQTLGSPIAYFIENKDWPNWQHVMGAERPAAQQKEGGAVAESGNAPTKNSDPRRVSRPRPGHADLAGGLKYNRADLRDILVPALGKLPTVSPLGRFANSFLILFRSRSLAMSFKLAGRQLNRLEHHSKQSGQKQMAHQSAVWTKAPRVS